MLMLMMMIADDAYYDYDYANHDGNDDDNNYGSLFSASNEPGNMAPRSIVKGRRK